MEGQIRNINVNEYLVMSVHDLKEKYAFAYIPQPSREERLLLKTIHCEGFYSHTDKGLQEKYYHLHMVCAAYNDNRTPIFSVSGNGKLSVKEDRYYAYRDPEAMNNLNPFSLDDMALIKTAARNGIDAEYEWRLEDYSALFGNCLPELAILLAQAISQDDEDLAESA